MNEPENSTPTARTETVAVTGAAGWIGAAVCAALENRGVTVSRIDRAALASGPGWSGDLAAVDDPPPGLCRALEGSVAVIHCAGRVHRAFRRLSHDEADVFRRANVETTRAVLRACARSGVRRIVYVSTIAGYDWQAIGENAADEDAPFLPPSEYAASKREAENLIRESGLDWRIVRLATVFGTGDRANFASLAAGLRTRRFILPGRGQARKSVMPLDCSAEVLCRLAFKNELKHRLMNAALPHAESLREITAAFGECCGFPPPLSVPLSLMETGARMGNFVARVVPGFPMTSWMLARLTTSTVVDTSRLRETFPDLKLPSFQEALAEVADYYRQVEWRRGPRERDAALTPPPRATPAGPREEDSGARALAALRDDTTRNPQARINPGRTALVTGATGFVGGPLARLLQAEGWNVIAGLHAGHATARRIEWAETFALDLRDPEPLHLPPGIDTIFHLAGKAHDLAEIAQEESEYTRINTDGTRRLLVAASEAGVRAFVYFSSVKAAGYPLLRGRDPMDENSNAPPETEYGRSKRAAEQLVLQGGYVPHAVVLRPSLVYGPSAKGNLEKMIAAVRAGRFPPIPEIGNRRSMVHVEDLCHAAILAATHPAAAGRRYIVCDGRPVSTRELFVWICEALERPVPTWTVPLAFLRFCGTAGDVIGRARGRRYLFDSEALNKLIDDAYYSSALIERELGWRPGKRLRDSLPGIIGRANVENPGGENRHDLAASR